MSSYNLREVHEKALDGRVGKLVAGIMRDSVERWLAAERREVAARVALGRAHLELEESQAEVRALKEKVDRLRLEQSRTVSKLGGDDE